MRQAEKCQLIDLEPCRQYKPLGNSLRCIPQGQAELNVVFQLGDALSHDTADIHALPQRQPELSSMQKRLESLANEKSFDSIMPDAWSGSFLRSCTRQSAHSGV